MVIEWSSCALGSASSSENSRERTAWLVSQAARCVCQGQRTYTKHNMTMFARLFFHNAGAYLRGIFFLLQACLDEHNHTVVQYAESAT